MSRPNRRQSIARARARARKHSMTTLNTRAVEDGAKKSTRRASLSSTSGITFRPLRLASRVEIINLPGINIFVSETRRTRRVSIRLYHTIEDT